MTDCQGLFDKMTLLNQVNFILSINAFRFIILRPPSQYCFITTFCLIFAGPFHKKSKNILFNSLIVCSVGFGIEINRWFNIGRRSVFITVILPKGVRYRLFQSLIKDLIFWIFSLKVNLLHLFSNNKLDHDRLAMFCWFCIPRWCEYSEVLQCQLKAPCSGLLASPRVT